jgi:hypothetical protein
MSPLPRHRGQIEYKLGANKQHTLSLSQYAQLYSFDTNGKRFIRG